MDEKLLLEKIDAYIKENERQIVADIATLVAQPSVEDKAAPNVPGAPFGVGARKALDAALDIAARMGFATHDGDGYVGWAQLDGKQEEYLATITHMDIVPEGEGWDGDPFVLREREGWLLARGVADDKGPSVLCLHAANFLKGLCQETGQPLRYGLRVLLGCNEETGMKDVPYYLEHNPQPAFCFSPDAGFPVCNGEKGHFLGWFVSPVINGGNILECNTGMAPNVIPGKATCLVNGDAAALNATDAVEVSEEKGVVRLVAHGVGGHAANPAGTQNAIGVLVDYLLANGLCTGAEEQFLRLAARLYKSAYGEGLGIATQDEMFKQLTINGGLMRLEDGVLKMSIDIRYPTSATGQALVGALSAQAAELGATLEMGAYEEPFYIPADSPAIQALLGAYNDVTGEKAEPFTMGGGTYARHFAGAVSYGPAPPDEELPDFAGPEHAANEGAYLPHLLQAMKIYILALWRLQAVDF